MEITIDNYEEREKEILEDIRKCDFVSFDLEMTGIAINNRHYLDSPSERYQKHKYSAEKYKIIQFGLVPWFKKTDNNQKITYLAKPYNIYVFPSKEFEHLSNCTNINCEISALTFNGKHGMNFNTWIYKGVNYVNERQFRTITFKNKDYNINKYVPLSKKINMLKKEDEEVYNDFEKKFVEFYTSHKKDQKLEYRKLPNFLLMHFINKISEQTYNNIYITMDDINNKLYIQKVTPEEKSNLIKEDNKKYYEELEKMKGVKKIWDEIIKNRKIIIGHNLGIDILFCYSHFGENLPESYEYFKTMARKSFGGLYDTKILYNNLSPKEETRYDSSLEVIYQKLFNKYKDTINVSIPKDFNDYIGKDNDSCSEFHQADFDAFITGLVFCYLTNNLIEKNDLEIELEKYNWKIFFMKSFYKCFDIEKNEEFIVPNTIPYVLKSYDRNNDIDLEKIINDNKLYSLIKEKSYIEGINMNAMLILVDPNEGDLTALEKKLMENQKLFSVYSLDSFKQMLKDEENQRKEKYRKNKNN